MINMFRSRSWFGVGWGRPKNPHSLEHLKYLYNVLSRNQTVSEHNRGLLVETLRSIAEILIWGDQNDSSVFDFFLEKNMLSFFLSIMKQRSGGSSYVCVQLLQTLNILFENIRNETSLYYLLSNNHVNSIIVHKFDFSDEEVMAYYISFLKTLSLKLNAHTIHFFYNEHTNDFPLYTEAIKFFNHPESMVRIAVRTLTLNVYKVDDASMLGFIRDRTAAPYFSNIVWFIGKHIQELDQCIRNDADFSQQSQNRLADLVAEHLDHLHYLNDILCLKITDLNRVLTDHLLHKLLIPLYIYSLTNFKKIHCPLSPSSSSSSSSLMINYESNNGKVSCVVALYLLSQVFLIISHQPLVQTLSFIILKSNKTIFDKTMDEILIIQQEYQEKQQLELIDNCIVDYKYENPSIEHNITDEEKEKITNKTTIFPITTTTATIVETTTTITTTTTLTKNNSDKSFLDTVYNSLDCIENDFSALFALSLLYAMATNKGIQSETIEQVLKPKKTIISDNLSELKDVHYIYNIQLVEKILFIIQLSCQPNCKVRLVTLELALKLLINLIIIDGKDILLDKHKQLIELAKTQSTALLRNFYKSEEIFLDMFENEYCDMSKCSLNVEWLCMDSAILLPPTGTPMTGIDFTKRLPCGEVERARRAIRVFFLIRNIQFILNGEIETQLPLTNPQCCVQIDQALDLSISRYNSDLIACTVMWKDGTKSKRFLVIDVLQLILVEPDTKRLGWGVAKFVGFLQDIEVTGDKDDSRCLHITIHRPLSGTTTNRIPLLNAKFIFDDNIRCMAAKQRLTKGRIKARQKKMNHIARLLEIPGQSGPPSPAFVGGGINNKRQSTSSISRRAFNQLHYHHHNSRGPGFATPDIIINSQQRDDSSTSRIRSRDSSHSRTRSNNRDGSPRSVLRPRSEEIPLELIKKTPNCVIDMSPKITMLPKLHDNEQHNIDYELNRENVPTASSLSLSNSSSSSSSSSSTGETTTVIEKSTTTTSEETSFIANDNKKIKSIVETI